MILSPPVSNLHCWGPSLILSLSLSMYKIKNKIIIFSRDEREYIHTITIQIQESHMHIRKWMNLLHCPPTFNTKDKCSLSPLTQQVHDVSLWTLKCVFHSPATTRTVHMRMLRSWLFLTTCISAWPLLFTVLALIEAVKSKRARLWKRSWFWNVSTSFMPPWFFYVLSPPPPSPFFPIFNISNTTFIPIHVFIGMSMPILYWLKISLTVHLMFRHYLYNNV